MKWVLWFTVLGSSLQAATEFPRPVAWDANLQNVKVLDVSPEFSPSSELGKKVEEKFKRVLKEKGFLAAKGEGTFNFLTPYAHCRPTYSPSDAPAGQEVCQVGLYFREHSADFPIPAGMEGKRVQLGIVASYSAMYPVTFPNQPEILERAFDGLLENFVADLEHQKSFKPRKK